MALLLALGTTLAFSAAGPIAAIGRHVSFSPNEGWNAYWAERALAGQPLYTDPSSPITNNYTPLSFYLVGWLGRSIGDFIVAGRLVSLFSLLACSFVVQQLVVALGGSRRGGFVGASCLLLFVTAAAPAHVVVDDPHWLSELPMLLALWLLVRSKSSPLSTARLMGACALMLLSGLIKQETIALPIAVTTWLALTDRRALVIWLIGAAAGGALALAWLARFGLTAITEIIFHVRVFHISLIASAVKTLTPLIPAMVFAVMLARNCHRRPVPGDRRLLLMFLFTGCATVLGVLERLGTGTAQNVHFDTAIGLFVLAGVALSRVEAQGSPSDATWAQLAVVGLLVLPLIGTLLVRDPGTIGRIADQAAAEDRWASAIASIHALPGSVACEQPALCYWAGKPFVVDFSNYGQKLRHHDPFGLARLIRRHAFSAIVSVRDKRYRTYNSRLPASYNRLIEANYRVQQVLPDHVFLLVPRPET